jgi:hypothetical protein
MSYQGTEFVSVTVYLEDDLPNGPYVDRLSEKAFAMHISPKATGDDLKREMQTYTIKKWNEQQATVTHNKANLSWIVTAMTYKGGPVPPQASLSSIIKSGEIVTMTAAVHASLASCCDECTIL